MARKPGLRNARRAVLKQIRKVYSIGVGSGFPGSPAGISPHQPEGQQRVKALGSVSVRPIRTGLTVSHSPEYRKLNGLRKTRRCPKSNSNCLYSSLGEQLFRFIPGFPFPPSLRARAFPLEF